MSEANDRGVQLRLARERAAERREQRYACDAVGETQAKRRIFEAEWTRRDVGQVELATIGVHAAPKLKQKRHTLTRRVSVEPITAAPVSVRTRCYLPVLNAGRGDGVALLRSS